MERLLREDFLQQHAYDSVDAFCSPEKQYWMLRAILTFDRLLSEALARGVALEAALAAPEIAELGRMKEWAMPGARGLIADLVARLEKSLVMS